MWVIIKKYLNNNIDTYYFKENATIDVDGSIIDFDDFKHTKVQIDKGQMLFHFKENDNEHTWRIISEVIENENFNLKQFTIEAENRTLKKVIIFNNVKMTIRNENLVEGIKHVYGKPGSLYEEHSKLLGKFG